jgi:Flp pilus assembly protein TadG
MVLVAIAMVAIIAMAALSIDVITLYLAREEAQRSADAAALAAARVISVSGMTGDPNDSGFSWQAICGTSGAATQAATAVATQGEVGGAVANSVSVTYSAGTKQAADCSTLTIPGPFGVNPLVKVQVTRTSLPTFFSRIWGNTGNSVSATATAEAFNPSASDLSTNGGPTGTVTPVNPSCVKPWVVPNLDPLNPSNPANCTRNCSSFVSTADGTIQNPGISTGGTGRTGVIGETFWLVLDCQHGNPNYCQLRGGATQPEANYNSGAASVKPPPNLLYVPGLVGINQPVAIPSCAQGDPYEEAVGGCDSPSNYQCGIPNNNFVDMSRNPDTAGTTTGGLLCLTHQTDPTDTTASTGQDCLNPSCSPFGAPSSYPFQIFPGSGNTLSGPLTGIPISSSNSIVSLPIYDQITANINNFGQQTTVTFVGFLQVFINAVDQYGNVNVTVLNVAGCGNGNTTPVGSTPVTGTSPVPIRLITPP